ncbi:hypothetical protein NLG97_g7231 [Lecanicillium saksenae]|uniref:Uncharacterized protein n=1 Tax=Lecanicillium saksenae TaxID=468837 RepID=A0ACC1QMZ1_9HYPO|nr:hypothetical protein NLG97_g7231 [Lecanicillium saksenae]
MAEHQQHPAEPSPATRQNEGAAAATSAATTQGTSSASAQGNGDDDEHAPAPGARATRLQDIYSQALGGTLKKLSFANFAGCYPTIAKRADNVLSKVQEQMVTQLQSRCDNEFKKIIKNRQVVEKLNELEGLVGEAEQARKEAHAAGIKDEPTPPHTLPPQAILAAHLHPALALHHAQLGDLLQQTQVQNALLVDEVRRQRAEVDELLRRLEDAAADVRGANEVLAGIVGELSEETRLDAGHV